MKNTIGRRILSAVAFTLIFALLLSGFTLIFYPKWKTSVDSGQMAGFYREPRNTIDVLFLGSCNMYTSVSPVLMYDEFGVTGYDFTCPDQELSTSYYYLRDALKRQKPKAVVIEALFFMAKNDAERETYNRFAFDYMPLSWNKIRAVADLAGRESEFMKQYDQTSSDTLLTFMSYLFPLLRYHSNTEITKEDFTFFLSDNLYNERKGNNPRLSYPRLEGYGTDLDWVYNGKTINDNAKEYFPKIKALCEKEGIPLVIMKSPNYVRWGFDDSYTGVIRDFAEKMGVPFIDMHSEEYNCFTVDDYAINTTLNVLGVQKLTHELGEYLVDNYGLTPTVLTEKQKAAWDECVVKYYDMARESGLSLDPGEINYIKNQAESSLVHWIPLEGSDRYTVYRAPGHSAAFVKLGEAEGSSFEDKDVTSGSGYTYYIEAADGADAGRRSQKKYNIYVEMPGALTARNENGVVRLDWEPAQKADGYFIYRRAGTAFKYSIWDRITTNSYANKNVNNGALYYYRVSSYIEEDDVRYESDGVFVNEFPLKDPVITSISTHDGKITIKWDKPQNVDKVRIYRRIEDRDDFVLYDAISAKHGEYTDAYNFKNGKTYFYKIVFVKNYFGHEGISADSNIVCEVIR